MAAKAAFNEGTDPGTDCLAIPNANPSVPGLNVCLAILHREISNVMNINISNYEIDSIVRNILEISETS